MAYPQTYLHYTETEAIRNRLIESYKAGNWGGYAFLKAIDSARIGPWIWYPLYELGAARVVELSEAFIAAGFRSADDVGSFLRAQGVGHVA